MLTFDDKQAFKIFIALLKAHPNANFEDLARQAFQASESYLRIRAKTIDKNKPRYEPE